MVLRSPRALARGLEGGGRGGAGGQLLPSYSPFAWRAGAARESRRGSREDCEWRYSSLERASHTLVSFAPSSSRRGPLPLFIHGRVRADGFVSLEDDCERDGILARLVESFDFAL
jgi:hypothetical protein